MLRDVNGIIKNSLKMPGSRGRTGPGGVMGQRPCGGPKGASPGQKLVKIRRLDLERINKEEI